MESIGLGAIAFLIAFPLLVALVLLFVKNEKARTLITVASAIVIACGAIFITVQFMMHGGQALVIAVDAGVSVAAGWFTFIVDLCLCAYIIGKGIRYKNFVAVLLALVQLGLVFWLEFLVLPGVIVSHALYIDYLSIIMALIIGIIGGGIAVYACGYMEDHMLHQEGSDRRNTFFAVIFAFLGAMFGIVFSNNLSWFLCAWEVTTVCSFALIGWTRTDEAIHNSFLQIILNLIGGIAFACALGWIAMYYGTIELNTFLNQTLAYQAGGREVVTWAPLLLLALAGFTKAAQMPFHSWLLGAMVAPTPTSALLHSSTMVKAGVFLFIKLAPCLGLNMPGFLVMLVGGVTFLFAALAAISQSNAKRVLAYSTISNLGLIVACAGIGTAGAIWAAIFLVVFHAAAKSLLFLCVGTAEHHVGSRDIESFDDLFERMPRLSRLMAIGIMGMFIAPFGMLVSKWAALQAFADSGNVILLMLMVFGSAATFMFWAKWFGKILSYASADPKNVEITVHRSEWAALGLMTILVVGLCVAFPLISTSMVVPYLAGVYGSVSSAIATGDLWIMAVIGLVLAVIFLSFTGNTKKKVVPIYLAGRGSDFTEREFYNTFDEPVQATQRNWYMTDIFPEKRTAGIGVAVALALIVSVGGFAVQQAAAQPQTLQDTISMQQEYRESLWGQNGIDSSLYQYIYALESPTYQANKDTYASQYGIEDMQDFMDKLYSDMEADYEANQADLKSTYGIDNMEEYVQTIVQMYSLQSSQSMSTEGGE